MSNLKKVVDLNGQQNEAIRQELEAVQKERKQYKITERQFDAVLGELIARLDERFIASVLDFNGTGTGVQWADDLERFVDKLDPSLKHFENKLSGALPDRYPAAAGEPDSDLTTMIWGRECMSYVVGCFVGAKLAGASDEKLNALRKHMIL